MNLMQRRAFFGTAVALAGGAAITALPFGTTPVVLAAKDDLVSKELAKQMKRAVRAVKAGQGEGSVREAAALLRVWAAHGQAQDYDPQMKALAKKARGKRGEVDHRKMAAELAEYGIEDMPIISDEKVAAATDRLAAEGITIQLTRVADLLDALAVPVGRVSSPDPAYKPVQFYENGNPACASVRMARDLCWEIMTAACTAARMFPSPATGDFCAAMAGAAAASSLTYWLLC